MTPAELAAADPTAPPPLADAELQADVVVVGAGIVGLSCALLLQRQGRAVWLLDRQGVAAQASRGNAGAFAFSDVLPLASPGILAQVPRWLLDPLGPLALRPAYLPALLSWLWRFWRASRPAAFARSLQAQVALMRLAAPATLRLLQAAGAQHLLHSGGNLHLYESEAEWKAALPGWQLRAEHGIAFEHAHGATAIARWQPGLSPALVAATFVPGWQTIEDPLLLCHTIAGAFMAAGGRLRQAAVQALQPEGPHMGLRLADGRLVRARHVVVAAGAWSHQLAQTLGERVPLETERGYNTTLPAGAFALQRQLSFPSHGFVVTPIAGGVRVGGAVELAGLRAAPNYRRAEVLLGKAQRFLPGLRTEGGTPWMGFRPSLPDSLPAIGPSPTDARVTHAFGHGHLGLTQSAATAEIVAALVAGRTPPLDLQPFNPARFA
ncbi:NAD(P)/FAD-dependent oxidoreductase [Rubrivivax rivuli]|uniref:FAD-dependent oxidoreductase n=1 Tax=Rubrivivax rivuli TaxID=1862385 RepID=A0A437RQV8_9BURK|nr:FAD-dependent oxidoreductase [Rubrivivax rivuli]RVU49158.1 FAD-dependent oxidoreductase [Rubrivivax rivuli]